MPSKLQNNGSQKDPYAAQIISRLPFSSPTDVEQISNGSFSTNGAATSSPYSGSPLSEISRDEHRSKLGRRDVENRGGWARSKKKPDLNIVTNFATTERAKLRHVLKGRARPTQEGVQSSGAKPVNIKLGSKGQVLGGGFVNLTDLESLRMRKRRSLRQRKADTESQKKVAYRRIGGEKQTQNVEELPSYQKAKSSNRTETVIIDISVPEMKYGTNQQSQDLQSAQTLDTPATPSIVVTPADESSDSKSSSPAVRARRPISSMYSEAARVVYGNDRNMPPVPHLPSYCGQSPAFSDDRSRHSIDSWEADSPRSRRPKSTETIFDEDLGDDTRARPASAGSHEGILLPSGSTGRPRSKGWWNLMLSPMLSRTPTATTKKTTSPDSPVIIGLPEATSRDIDFDQKTLMTAYSPETPRRAGLASARNSPWSSWTQWEQDRELLVDTKRFPNDGNGPVVQLPAHNESRSPAQLPLEPSRRGPGLAAAYYEASVLDQQNPSPRIRDVNHICGCVCPKTAGHCNEHVPVSTDVLATSRSVPAMAVVNGQRGTPGRQEEARIRSDSESTIIEDDPIEFSPTVRKAQAKQIQKMPQAKKVALSSSDVAEGKGEAQVRTVMTEKANEPASRTVTPPSYSPPPNKSKRPYWPVALPSRSAPVTSPADVLSPEGQRAVNPGDGYAMSQVHPPPPTFITYQSTYPTNLPPRLGVAPVSLADIENPKQASEKVEARRRQLEKEDVVAHKAGGLWRGRGCFPQSGCQGRGGAPGRHRRRWYIVIASTLVLMIILIVVLATQLTRKGDQTPIQSQWLNLTGFPPMPTGISTIARPDIASTSTACVRPSSLWSCALPKEDQTANLPNDPDQPNFRLQIRFRNGTVSVNGTIPVVDPNDGDRSLSRRAVQLKRQNDLFTNKLFEPSPTPPSTSEQSFLGNTTDKIVEPFAGEATPFFISLLTSDPTLPANFNKTDQGSRRRVRRQTRVNGGNVPAPSVLFDGTAAPANLLPNSPLPFSQPVMLYNRGLDTEHYGFYTYYDRSIFVKTNAQFNSSASSSASSNKDESGSDIDNSNGGVPKQDADLRCTWTQTRFLVQIWTSPNFGGRQFPSQDNNNPTSGPSNSQTEAQIASSATDFDRPGSFPYPVTVTLDRHGGDASKKGAYCYGVDSQAKIVVSDSKLVAELRAAGGSLINAAAGVFSNAAGDSSNPFSPSAGGIDGGSGGCRCEWRNWAGDGGAA